MSDPLFFENDPYRNKGLKQKLSSLNPFIIGMLSIGTLLIIVLSIWAFYPTDEIAPESLPVIYAEKTPLRVKPETEDINVASDYNSRIYDTFGQTGNSRRIENLLTENNTAEEPLSKEELFAGINPQIQNRSKVISITDETGLNSESAPPSNNELAEVAEQKIVVRDITQSPLETEEQEQAEADNKIAVDVPFTPSRSTGLGIFENSTEQPSETAKNNISEEDARNAETTEPAAGALSNVPESAPPAKEQASQSQTGNYYVQLASIQDKAKTEESWKKLSDKHQALQNVSYRTETAEIAGKGTFYRVQAGPLSKDAANTLCDTIKSQSGSCFVTSK